MHRFEVFIIFQNWLEFNKTMFMFYSIGSIIGFISVLAVTTNKRKLRVLLINTIMCILATIGCNGRDSFIFILSVYIGKFSAFMFIGVMIGMLVDILKYMIRRVLKEYRGL